MSWKDDFRWSFFDQHDRAAAKSLPHVRRLITKLFGSPTRVEPDTRSAHSWLQVRRNRSLDCDSWYAAWNVQTRWLPSLISLVPAFPWEWAGPS